MKLTIQHQERYSRGELLLRSFFGFLYMYLPHGFLLIFVGFWGAILQFVAFWIILFTGRYPESMFQYQAGLVRWETRLLARMYQLSDGYPGFGLKATDDRTEVSIPYPEKVSRGLTLLRLFFGVLYVGIPHGLILLFRAVFVGVLIFVAWWAVLFTARYPATMHQWVVGQMRWQLRVTLYLTFMTDTYPPFTGDELPEEKQL